MVAISISFALIIKEGFMLKLLFFKDFIYLFLDRREGEEKERERNINVWMLLPCPQLGTWPACNPGMCPEWELNW